MPSWKRCTARERVNPVSDHLPGHPAPWGLPIEGLFLPRRRRRAGWYPVTFLVTMAEDGFEGLRVVRVEPETIPDG